VEATPARTYDEVAATKTMVKRTDERMGLKPKYLAADTAYGTGKFLSWLIGTGITPYIPVSDMSQREDGTFSRADFTFDKEHNVYLCPAGKLLMTTGKVHDGRTILYRASSRDCGSCPIKPQCTPNMTFRKIPRDVHEDARDQARALMGTPEFAKSRWDFCGTAALPLKPDIGWRGWHVRKVPIASQRSAATWPPPCRGSKRARGAIFQTGTPHFVVGVLAT
jgi:Transposase DDE domain